MVAIFNSETIFAFMLVFSRVAATFMMLPGVGELYVAARVRLLLALMFSVLLSSVVTGLPIVPSSISLMFLLLAIECLIGLFLGLITRVVLSAAHILGMIVTNSSGLGMAMIFDPISNAQGSAVGVLFTNIALLLLFITNLHHLIVQALVDSYHIFPPGNIIIGDLTEFLVETLAESFVIALKMGAPQIIIAILLMVTIGVMSRLMPTIQIFFLMTPIQLLASFVIWTLIISSSMMWYLESVHGKIDMFIGR